MMFDSPLFIWLHFIVGWLLQPVTAALLGLLALVLWDIGVALGERSGGLARWRRLPRAEAERRACRRLDRADLTGRIGPMLGLMGTLIPLGPGLAALGDGDVRILSTAMLVAFDTTVIGLVTGAAGFLLGRLRRRWYDAFFDQWDAEAARPGRAADGSLLAP
jgi:hypothetical protein